METFELRYFVGVAQTENIHRASEKLHVSPGSLSKAITRLEEELAVQLFHREGRSIRLTEEGRLLQKRASEILQLEEATKLELSGVKGSIKVQIVGNEILLAKMGVLYSETIKKKHPLCEFEFLIESDEAALERLSRGEAHLAIVTSDVSSKSEFRSKVIGETKFQTYVGKGHPLYRFAKNGAIVPVNEVLEYPFVVPTHSILGKTGNKQSLDGWRDDEFPRKIEYHASSLKILEELVISGNAVAYLPEYFGKDLMIEALQISDCPYMCQQKIKLVSRKSKDVRWINELF
jgi:DNA-binding transcriptional LysR family regulator